MSALMKYSEYNLFFFSSHNSSIPVLPHKAHFSLLFPKEVPSYLVIMQVHGAVASTYIINCNIEHISDL